MRDRLIKLLKTPHKADWLRQKGYDIGQYEEDCVEAMTADLLLANGVIVPPVSVGQKVWYIKGGYYNSVHKRPCEIEITEINQKWHGKILDWGFIAHSTRYRFSSIGKTVFLTREEAEAALAEREGKG